MTYIFFSRQIIAMLVIIGSPRARIIAAFASDAFSEWTTIVLSLGIASVPATMDTSFSCMCLPSLGCFIAWVYVFRLFYRRQEAEE
jgi:hypothetical protein